MLNEDQIAFFRRHGYLVVEDVLGEDILAPLRAEYAALLKALYDGWRTAHDLPPVTGFADRLIAAYGRGLDWFQPMDISLPGDRIRPDTPFHAGPAAFGLLRAAGILDVVESLIGGEITSVPIQHVRIKPPERLLDPGEIRAHVGGTDWHQDRGVTHAEADATDMLTVWVAVTDATVENGCLQVAPRLPDGLLPHCPQRQTAIAKGFLDPDAGLPLPVRAGGIVLLDPLLPHASLRNRSDGIRWSFDLRYCQTGQPTGRAHFPGFVARSRARPETELSDWRDWRALWVAARARLAAAPHVEIHRWAADAPVCA